METEKFSKETGESFLEGVLGNIFLKSRQCEVSGESFGIYTIFACGCCHLLALVSVDGEVLWSHAVEPKQKLWISDATDVCDLSPCWTLLGISLWPWPP